VTSPFIVPVSHDRSLWLGFAISEFIADEGFSPRALPSRTVGYLVKEVRQGQQVASTGLKRLGPRLSARGFRGRVNTTAAANEFRESGDHTL